MKRILNWKKQPEDQRDFVSTRYSLAPVTLPSKFELPLDIPVYDQLDIGSCVANSACSCYRYESAQVVNDFKFEPSRLFVYYNSRAIQGWENEDSGAYIRDGFKSLNKWGLANESLWPYVPKDFSKKPSVEVYADGLNNTAVKYAAVVQNETVIKQTLISGAAISFGFNVYSSFFGTWESSNGIMPLPRKGERLEGGHAVTIVGYDDSKRCFLIQNSWGTGWGLKGKFWMPYTFLLNPKEADDFWCIEEIKIIHEQVPEPITPVEPTNVKNVIQSIFSKREDLLPLKEQVIVNIGNALGIGVNINLAKKVNVNLVCNELGIK